MDWEIIWSRLINIWEARVRIPSAPLLFLRLGERVLTYIENVTAWIGLATQRRSLQYCYKRADKLISEINNERLISKLQNMSGRDKTTKGMVS